MRAFALVSSVFSILVLSISASHSSPFSISLRDGAEASSVKTNDYLIRVHDDEDDEEDEDDDGRDGRGGYHDGDYAAAPYARVQRSGRVIVDAPYANVYVGRNGRRIVAPFVDIRIPR